MGGLDGKLALVTGASRGYGRAIAERLASDGALVVVHYAENEAAADATVASIRRSNGQAFRVRAPLDGSLRSVAELFARLDEGLATAGRAPTIRTSHSPAATMAAIPRCSTASSIGTPIGAT